LIEEGSFLKKMKKLHLQKKIYADLVKKIKAEHLNKQHVIGCVSIK
jgi:hypothetical protein